MPLTESRASETIVFQVQAAVLAEACVDTLRRIGSVKEVSRETGTIAGKLSPNPLANAAFINLRISQKGESESEVHIQTQRREGLLTQGGAQKALGMFLTDLGHDPRLKGRSTAGW